MYYNQLLERKKVVIIGADFAGLSATKKLNKSKYEVTLIDLIGLTPILPIKNLHA